MDGHFWRLAMSLICCIIIAVGEPLDFAIGWCGGLIYAVLVLGGPDLINRYCAEIERWWKS